MRASRRTAPRVLQRGALLAALPLALAAAALWLPAAPAHASEVPPPRTGDAPPEDIVVTARRRHLPDLQETQEFNAEELARLRAEFEPPPPRTPRAYESEAGVGTRTAGVRSMISQSPRLRDIEIPQ
jgi:hypothetical protein